MLQVSLAEKIEVLTKIIMSSPIFICITIFTILLNIALYINKDNKQNIKKAFIAFYIVLFIGLILAYGNTIIGILDYLVENIIKLIYFPNLAAYIIMIILANVIILKTLLSDKNSYIKLINTTIYSVIILLFLITLYIVTKNGIDVYKMFDVYTNKDLLVLIEISSNITVIWLIAITISRLIDFISIKIDSKNVYAREEKITSNDFISVKEVKKTNKEPRKIKNYNGSVIDIPLTPAKAKISIFSHISSLINNLVDTVVNLQKKKVIHNEELVEANDSYLNKVLLEEERPHKNKYITITEISKEEPIPKLKHNEFFLDENITLAECYELRKSILLFQEDKRKAQQ